MKKICLFVIVILSSYNSYCQEEKSFLSVYETKVCEYPKITLYGTIFPNNSILNKSLNLNSDFLKIYNKGKPCKINSIEPFIWQDSVICHFIVDTQNIQQHSKKNIINFLNQSIFNTSSDTLSPFSCKYYFTKGENTYSISYDSLINLINDRNDSISTLKNANEQIASIITKPNKNWQFIYLINNIDSLLIKNLKQGLLEAHANKKILLCNISNKENDEIECNNNTLFSLGINNPELVKISAKSVYDFFNNTFFEICFKMPQNHENKHIQDSILITYEFGENIYSNKINLLLHDSIIKKDDIFFTITEANRLIEKQQDSVALELIYGAFEKTPSDTLKKCLQTYFFNYIHKLIDSTVDIVDVLNYYENIWKIDSIYSSSYKKQKLSILNTKYTGLIKTGNYNDLIKVNNTRIQIDDQNETFRLESFRLNAELSIKSSNYEKTINNYCKYLDIKSNKDIKKKLKQIVIKYYTIKFPKKSYWRIFEIGKKCMKYFQNDFSLHYYYGASSYKLGLYKKALKEYKWIKNNWEDNNLVSLEDIDKQLINIYLNKSMYSEAMDLCQKAYRLYGGINFINKYIYSIRLLYMRPIMDVLTRYNKINSSVNVENSQISKFEKPNFILGIYKVNKKGDILINYIDSKKKNNIQVNFENCRIFPSVLFSNNDSTILFINKENSNYLIFELSSKLNSFESIIISNIKKRKNDVEPWVNFNKHEELILINISSHILTNLYEKSLIYSTNSFLSDYWKSKDNSKKQIMYFVFHNKKGEVINNFSFNKKDASYLKYMWEKSKITPVFFQQEIRYNKKEVIEISNPINNKKKIRIGVLRIGYMKQF